MNHWDLFDGGVGRVLAHQGWGLGWSPTPPKKPLCHGKHSVLYVLAISLNIGVYAHKHIKGVSFVSSLYSLNSGEKYCYASTKQFFPQSGPTKATASLTGSTFFC